MARSAFRLTLTNRLVSLDAMVQTRDPATTKARILEAAFAEFSARGFAGARVDEIAAKANVNKALLYHYYGDKSAIFRNVLECKMAALAEMELHPERLPEIVGDVFDLHAANPWISRLLSWEALDFGLEEVPNEQQRRERLEGYVNAIRRAQQQGLADGALDASQTLATVMGMVTFWFAFPQAARMIAGGDPYTPDMLKKRRAHVVDVARRILEAR